MRAKILSIIILLFFQSQFIFSQCISVELSVIWETGYDIFKKDSMVCVPKLNITYRNNSSINYYFLKVSDSRDGLPMTPLGTFLQYPVEEYLNPDYLKRAKSYSNYTNQNFHVRIGSMTLFSAGWVVHNDTINYYEEHEIEYINDELANIYEYIYRNNGSKYIEKSIYFSSSDITPENILATVKSQFVFLKPGEIYIDSYNLVGFNLVKGYFTFFIDPNNFTNYVHIEPIWDKNQSRWIEQKMELPVKVGEYNLYSGEFYSNEVRVNFK